MFGLEFPVRRKVRLRHVRSPPSRNLNVLHVDDECVTRPRHDSNSEVVRPGAVAPAAVAQAAVAQQRD